MLLHEAVPPESAPISWCAAFHNPPPDEPCSVVPAAHRTCQASMLHAAPMFAEVCTTGVSKTLIFFSSPRGWWIATPWSEAWPSALQPAKCGEERTRIHLENALADLLDANGDSVPVHGLQLQRFQDEHVQRALHQRAGFA